MGSRSERLLTLIQALRRHRRPVTAQQLATELSVSVRTIYRDIETLVAQGILADIPNFDDRRGEQWSRRAAA